MATVILELGILVVDGWIYFRSSVSDGGPIGKYGMLAFLIALAILTVLTPFQTFPDTLTASLISEIMYVLLALTAYWLDSKRNVIL